MTYRHHTIKVQLGVGERAHGEASGSAYYVCTITCEMLSESRKGKMRHPDKAAAISAAKKFIDKRLTVEDLGNIVVSEQEPIPF